MKPRGQSSNFKEVVLPKAQSARARCYGVIDLGIVDNSYKGEEKTAHKIMLLWELPDLQAVFKDDGEKQPFMILEEFTFTTGEKGNLAKLVSSWRNKPFTADERAGNFDPSVFLNKTALLQFSIKRKGAYKGDEITKVTNVNSRMALSTIMPLPAAMKEGMPKMINKPILFDWDKIATPQDLDMDVWDTIPNFIRKKIRTSEEYLQRNIASVDTEHADEPNQVSSDDDDDFGSHNSGNPPAENTAPASESEVLDEGEWS
jgi:hypothetical protein